MTPPPTQPSPPPVEQNKVFTKGTVISKGQSWVRGSKKLGFQGDGNLVIYNSSNQPLWASGTNGTGHRAVFQGDGNFVICNSQKAPVFATGTMGVGHILVFQTDGNLVIYDSDGKPVWSTGTHD